VSKKSKPATAGEKCEMKATKMSLAEMREWPDAVANARRIDAAIGRAVLKEQQRRGTVVHTAKRTGQTFDWAMEWISYPEHAARRDNTEREPER